MTDSPPSSKVYYRPIEAAIRWAGLLKFEKEIVSRIPTPINLPPRIDCCPRWSELRLHGASAKRPRLGTMRSLRALRRNASIPPAIVFWPLPASLYVQSRKLHLQCLSSIGSI